MMHEIFIDNVTRLRLARGLSREQLAKLAGISVHTIKSMELRLTGNPTLDTINRLAVALRVDPGTLFREWVSSDPDLPAASTRRKPA